MFSHQTIQQLSRKIVLLDQYALTLQRQNLAKNIQTQTLYRQLHEMRMENQILKNHLDRKQSIKSIKSIQKIHLNDNQVSSSVEDVKYLKMKEQQKQINVCDHNNNINKDKTNIINNNTKQQSLKIFIQIQCQTDQSYQTLHNQCSLQTQGLLQRLNKKQQKLVSITKQSHEMFDIITKLQKQNDQLKCQINQWMRKMGEIENMYKEKSKQVKMYLEENNQLKRELKEMIDVKDNYQITNNHNHNNSNNNHNNNNQYNHTNSNTNSRINPNNRTTSSNADCQSTISLSFQVQRLIKQNNKLIQRIRMLQKQKNTYYKQLKTVSPLKKSQINYENRSTVMTNGFYQASSVLKNKQSNHIQSYQANTKKFSEQFSIGKNKEKMKSQRWKMIEDKINAVKSQNQSLKANLQY